MEIPYETILKVMDALDTAEQQFSSYGRYHSDKNAVEKAAMNYGYAKICERALEALKMEVEAYGR